MKPLDKAVRYFGSRKKLAEAIDVPLGTLIRWLKTRDGIPTSGEVCLRIERVTNGVVKAKEFYPEIFTEAGDKSCQANH